MTDDERIARLQRLAYGADTPDPDRARAVDELAELAATGRGDDLHAAPGERFARAAASEAPDADATTSEPSPDPHGPGPGVEVVLRARPPRGSVLLGLAGLVVGAAIGAAVGTAVGRSVPPESGPESADVAPTGPAFGSGEPGTPLGGTLLPVLFERLPPVADTAPLDQALGGIDPASVHLLATRADGPAAYLARTSEGTDVCLVLLVASEGPAQGTCTAGGLMPAGGLRIRYASPTEGFVVAILNSAGTITLGLDAGR